MRDRLDTEDLVIFTTRDFATRCELSLSAAAKRLARLAEKQQLTKVTKGIWAKTAHPYFHPLSCVPYLLAKEQGYVSFLTALHLHGVISQIPKTIQIATTGRGRILASPIANFEFFQIKPELMREGADWSESKLAYLIAGAEKALVDTLYLSTRKNRRFARLPELDVTHSVFRQREFMRLINQLPIPLRILSAMRSRSPFQRKPA
ncbi:MAG: putative transcriptional regulator of viral defense system [Gammaproteobacteria bacterium]